MKRIVFILLLLSITAGYSQKYELAGEEKTETLKGSEQVMMSECGAGKTSIEQIITTMYGKNGGKDTYEVETILWFRFTDAEGRRCYGNWRYDLMSMVEKKQTLAEVKKEKERQAKKAFDLLDHLQREGNH